MVGVQERKYSAKSASIFARELMIGEGRSFNIPTKFFKKLWTWRLLAKVQWMGWKLLKNIVPIGYTVRKHHVDLDGDCTLSGKPDTIYHALLECHLVAKVWCISPLGARWD